MRLLIDKLSTSRFSIATNERKVDFLSLYPPLNGILDKLELLIKEKQAELQGLEAELREALTGVESPDYETAGRLQPIIYGVMSEIRQLEINTFYRKTRLRSPDQIEIFCQIISVALLKPLKPLWGHGQQYYRIK